MIDPLSPVCPSRGRLSCRPKTPAARDGDEGGLLFSVCKVIKLSGNGQIFCCFFSCYAEILVICRSRGSISIIVVLQFQPSHLGIRHAGHILHVALVIDSLDGLVDDAMPHCKHRQSFVFLIDEMQELAGTVEQVVKLLDVLWPWQTFQVGNIAAREVAPVALAQQGCGDDGLMVRLCYDAGSVGRTFQVAGYNDVYVDVGHVVAHLFGLSDTHGVQLALHLALHQLEGIVDGLAVTHEI